jgi:hydroxymethylglutaryl-CoA reductase
MKSSRIKELHKHPPKKRREILFGSTDKKMNELFNTGGLSIQKADDLIENLIGVFSMPLSIVPNFTINGVDYLIPMVTEEPSVVAGASNGAKLARDLGGFQFSTTAPIVTSQILLMVDDPQKAWEKISKYKESLIEELSHMDPLLVKAGGGVDDIEKGDGGDDKTLVIHLHINSADAMGANVANSMAEVLKVRLEKISGGIALASIVTNGFPRRKSKVTARFLVNKMGKGGFTGEQAAFRFLALDSWAQRDPLRAVTHNKGIMNGISSVAMATGNDFRAVESSAHFGAVKNSSYKPLSRWVFEEKTDTLKGELQLSIPIGTIGGMTSHHPIVKKLFELLGINSANLLVSMAISAGLANNFAALWSISTEGIQKGHMILHKRRT